MRRRLAFILVTAVLLILPSAAQASPGAPPDASTSAWFQAWPNLGHDAQRTNQSPTDGPTQPRLLFERKNTAVGLVSADGSMYGATGKRPSGQRPTMVPVALDPSGHLRWLLRKLRTYVGPYIFPQAITPVGNLVLLVQGPGSATALLGLSPDRRILWKIDPYSPDKSGPAAITDSGLLYKRVEHDPYGGLDIFQAETGSLVRILPHAGFSNSAVASDGSIYESGGPMLRRFAPDGSLAWETSLPDSATIIPSHASFPLIEGTRIYVAVGHALAAFDTSGKVLWEISQPDQRSTLPHCGHPPVETCKVVLAAGANGSVLVAGYHEVQAVSSNGTLLWKAPIGPAGRYDGSSPSLVSDRTGTAYVGTADGRVRIFSAEGQLLRTLRVGRPAPFSPGLVLANGRLIVDGTDGTLRVYTS